MKKTIGITKCSRLMVRRDIDQITKALERHFKTQETGAKVVHSNHEPFHIIEVVHAGMLPFHVHYHHASCPPTISYSHGAPFNMSYHKNVEELKSHMEKQKYTVSF
jgi:hypothetical protein